jgi:hypothetical protein
MKASEVKCPKCGAGVVDIAPDLELAIEDDGALTGLVPVATQTTFGHCASGHKLAIKAVRGIKGQPSPEPRVLVLSPGPQP